MLHSAALHSCRTHRAAGGFGELLCVCFFLLCFYSVHPARLLYIKGPGRRGKRDLCYYSLGRCAAHPAPHCRFAASCFEKTKTGCGFIRCHVAFRLAGAFISFNLAHTHTHTANATFDALSIGCGAFWERLCANPLVRPRVQCVRATPAASCCDAGCD